MKKISSFVAILFAIVMMFSCNKESELKPVEMTQDEIVLQRILDFKDNVENPSNLKSGEMISIDSAVWYVEAALNYTYCISEEPVIEFNDVYTDSIVLVYEIENNEIEYYHAITLYNEIYNSLEDKSNSLDLEQKSIRMTDVEFTENKINC